MASNPVQLKITFFPSEEIRRHTIDLTAPPTFAAMRDSLLSSVVPIERRHRFVFKYCDDEGDYVTIGSEEEWQDMLLYTRQRPLRIQIIDPNSGGGEAAAASQQQQQRQHRPSAQQGEPHANLGEGIATLISQVLNSMPSVDWSQFSERFSQWHQQQAGSTQSCPFSSCASSEATQTGEQQQQQQPGQATGFDEFLRQNPQFQPYAERAMQFLQHLQASGCGAGTTCEGAASSSSSNPAQFFESMMRGFFGQQQEQAQQPARQAAQTREQQLAALHELGYLDDETNNVLLDRFHGNIERVVQEYVQFTSGMQ